MGYSDQKLPECWTIEMDFFICDCDARDVELKVMMKNLKKLFPELKRHPVEPPSSMPNISFTRPDQITHDKLEARIRCLDETPGIKYFKPGAVARYRQFVDEGRIKDKYPEDVDYLNSDEMLKDCELAIVGGGGDSEFVEYTGKGKGKPVRTLSGGFLDALDIEDETNGEHRVRVRVRGGDDGNMTVRAPSELHPLLLLSLPLQPSLNLQLPTQATSLLNQLRERSEPKATKLSPAKEAARVQAATLKERMQAKHRRSSSSTDESKGLTVRAGNVSMGHGGSSTIRAVGVEEDFEGMSLGRKSSPRNPSV
ncbi:hypothetical protein MMC08_002633 [Hypocenomyce scalaris]|nr:hypothetical protein [Hypocenomyce scalaris]